MLAALAISGDVYLTAHKSITLNIVKIIVNYYGRKNRIDKNREKFRTFAAGLQCKLWGWELRLWMLLAAFEGINILIP